MRAVPICFPKISSLLNQFSSELIFCNTLQHTTAHHSTVQYAATHGNIFVTEV